MDELSLRAANLLVGNDDGAAALEITMRGPDLRAEADHVVSLAGAPFDVRLDGGAIEMGRSFEVGSGSTMSIGSAAVGIRCYLAVRGGIDVPVVLGSRSTLVAAAMGGVAGRALAEADEIRIGPAEATTHARFLSAGAGLPLAHDAVLRVVPGPQIDSFTDAGVRTFYSSAWRVSPRSDRAGVRLDGGPVELAGKADLDPEGVVAGAVQVPSDGLPIVLGPDGPATGGYVKIATVISADLPLLAQARPGDTLRFAEISVEDARAAWRERVRALRAGVEER